MVVVVEGGGGEGGIRDLNLISRDTHQQSKPTWKWTAIPLEDNFLAFTT